MTDSTGQALYQRLGAEAGISAAVNDFYQRVLADPELQPYFAETDVVNLRRHQVLFLSAATGGPAAYDGRDMAAAHAQRGITDAHFDRVVTHLVETLTDLGVDQGDIDEVGAALLPLRADIVTA